MDTVKEFEERFEPELTDLLVLIKTDVDGAAVAGDMLRPSVEFVASVNTETGEFSRETGRLEWLIKNKKLRMDWGYNFKQYQICRIRARKNIPITLEPYMRKSLNNCYMVVEVVEKNASEPRLDALKEHLLQPVSIEDASLGTFTLDRKYSCFEGTIDWIGTTCIVYMQPDEEDGDTAEKAHAYLQELHRNIGEWDKKFRNFATEQLWELANEWYDGEDEEYEDEDADIIHITKEAFFNRISIQSIIIRPSGNLTMYYYDDDMFAGHSIEIDSNIDGTLKGTDIVG